MYFAVTFICIVSAAIQCGSVHVGMFLAGRLVNGFGVGMINILIPLYQSEISPPSQRSRLMGLHGAILVAGYSCGGWTSYGAYFSTKKELQWRLPLGIQLLAPIALLIGSPWLPESPRWLIGHGREEQGMTVLSNLHRTVEDPDATGARLEFREIQNQIHIEAEERIDTLWKCLCTPDVRRRMITASVFNGFCKVPAYLLFSTTRPCCMPILVLRAQRLCYFFLFTMWSLPSSTTFALWCSTALAVSKSSLSAL
ncbi:hypothetical protein Sste5346_003152 [Sporothrix stenoceras]|uniref:Major facilitator superfamily (MFS) profile domain-containing protein n=1 Tax=Sporothrix stenoceras TaxID=5173 RepID=A0ABR3ZFT6_9PEZI